MNCALPFCLLIRLDICPPSASKEAKYFPPSVKIPFGGLLRLLTSLLSSLTYFKPLKFNRGAWVIIFV
jgi:hypothetical protein